MVDKRFRLQRHALGSLLLAAGDPEDVVEAGTPVVVTPARAFPYSDPERFISFLDAAGRERASVAQMSELPPDEQELVRQALAEREFIPEITRVVRVVDEQDPEVWEVETDRGPTRFLLRNADDVRRLGPHRQLIVDVHGVRYSVADSRRLDPFTRRVLARY